ncbi:hypothetical protein D9613_008398 [Agrocybe pediades]|uniref:Enoyl reductase (ER) domain-containing protein n=1 Tax=Agrocybe pediades TaxID=84607 RepID=A0A8H4QT24_9AGAR|nr:hypothetical protein D9613_008398 [Agrocybe pediades]
MSSTQTQQALILEGPSGPFSMGEVPVRGPAPGEVLIKIHSAALTPADWKIPKYQIMVQEFPAILGSDIAGEIEAVGEGVNNFKKGDRVFCQAQDWKYGGAFQQYVSAIPDIVSKIPGALSYDDASTLPVAIATSYSGLYADLPQGLGLTPPATEEGYGKYANTPILVLGGASSVGQAVIQFAKISGFSPIIVTASLRNSDALKEFGATHVLDRTLSPADILAEVGKITSTPVEYIFDVVASESTQKLAVELLAKSGGRVAFPTPFLSVSETDNVKIAKVYAGPRVPWNLSLYQALYKEKLYEWIEKGFIAPNRSEALPGGLKGITEGLRRMEADEVSRLKLVAHPQETD